MEKYDRQLRLWGAHGQKALMENNVLVLSSSATSSEFLKNLVLPGIGQFTIVDDAKVSMDDLSNNFFVDQTSLQLPRANVVRNLLIEMNPDVCGSVKVCSPKAFVQGLGHEHDLDEYTLIVATQMHGSSVQELAKYCYANKKPLLVLRSYGLVGSFRAQLVDHTIVEAKPDTDKIDLRIFNPFRGLEEYCNTIELGSLDSMEHAHVPYVVILFKMNATWKKTHDGELPKTFDEKNAYKFALKEMSNTEWGQALNFVEAYDNAYRAYTNQSEISQDLFDVLNNKHAKELSENSSKFWILVHVLGLFLKMSGDVLPQCGSIPDMAASTKMFKELQQVYQSKAMEDKDWMMKTIQEVLVKLDLPTTYIGNADIDLFCKNTANIQASPNRSLESECLKPNLEDIELELQMEPNSQNPGIWYLLLQAVDSFYTQKTRYPGTKEDAVADDERVLHEHVELLSKKLGSEMLGNAVSNNHVKEVIRFANAEIHNIAAIIGGIGAQEAIKVITHQYVPLHHTYIYNGISGIAGTYAI